MFCIIWLNYFYKIYNINDLPKIILGYKIKNKFDEVRRSIKNKYKPRYISHFRYNTQLEPVFFYGVEINPVASYKSLLDTLNTNVLVKTSTPGNFRDMYKAVLADYDLTCNDCYRHLCDGIYPIDICHLPSISRTSYTKELKTGLSDILENNESTPWYLTLPNFSVFVLTRSVGYSIDYKRG